MATQMQLKVILAGNRIATASCEAETTKESIKTKIRLQAVSLFSWSVEQNARDTQMTKRVTRGFAAQRSRARALPSLNLKKKRDCSQSRRKRKAEIVSLSLLCKVLSQQPILS